MGAKAEGASVSQIQAFRRTPQLYLLTSPLSTPVPQLYSGVWQGDKHPGKQQLHLSLIFQLTFVMHPEKEKSEIFNLTDRYSIPPTQYSTTDYFYTILLESASYYRQHGMIIF